MAEHGAEVFISYRAADDAGSAAALELARRLKNDLSDTCVYHAPSDNQLTGDWSDEMDRRLQSSNLLIAVIGPDWETGATETDRLRDPDDWVRKEIAHAVASDNTDILPILVDRTRSPERGSMPPDIRPLATTHGIADFDIRRDYQTVLMQAWASFHAHEPDVVLVVSDDTAQGRVAVAEMVEALRERNEVDESRLRTLSQAITAPPGTAAIPLRAAHEEFPTVVLLDPETIGEHWRQRRRAMERWIAEHPDRTLEVIGTAVVGGGALTLGGSVVKRSATEWWRSLATSSKAALVGTSAVGAALLAGVFGGSPVLPTTFTYADMTYRTGEVEVIAHPPGIDPAEPDPDPDIDHALLELSIENEAGVPTEAVRFVGLAVADLWQLQIEGGDPIPSEGLWNDASSSPWQQVNIYGQSALEQEWALSFPIPAGRSVSGAALIMRLNEMSPLVVPLNGETFEHPVVDVTVVDESLNGPFGTGAARLTVLDAQAGFEAGVDPETGVLRPSPDFGLQRRAPEGFAFLTIEVEAAELDPGIYGALSTSQPWVVSDGERYEAADDGFEIPSQGSARFTVVGRVPLDARSVAVAFAGRWGDAEPLVAEVDPSFLDDLAEGGTSKR